MARAFHCSGDDGWKAADTSGTVRGEVSWGSEGKIGLDGLYFSAPGENATLLRLTRKRDS